MKKKAVLIVLFCLCCQSFSQDSLKRAIVLKSSALYDEPLSGLLPQSFAEKGDSCVVDSFFTDSAGVTWFRLAIKGARQWANGIKVSYITAENQDVQSLVLRDDADAKRRLRILRDHQDWPRRIKGAVREGRVCLGMTRDQLAAAWGDPMQKGSSFMVGTGECETWFFKGVRGNLLFVNLLEGAVAGWYLKDL